jgi:hypothetical protein
MSWLMRDLRYGLRESLRRPGFTALAILTLALGIGSVTAMFKFRLEHSGYLDSRPGRFRRSESKGARLLAASEIKARNQPGADTGPTQRDCEAVGGTLSYAISKEIHDQGL